MTQKRAIRCHYCKAVTRRLQEVHESRREFQITWGRDAIGELRELPKAPVSVYAICECGNTWRLRCVSSVDEVSAKFKLRNEITQ